MDINMYDQVLRLRAIRNYEKRPVSATHVDQLVEAARWTGSSKNSQNWSFIVVDDPQQQIALADAGDFTGPVINAPLTIALVQEPDGYEFDTGRMAQNIMLAGDALGLATCPITLHRDEVAAEVLGLPEGRRCRYAIAVGYPGEAAEPARFGGRKPVDEVRFFNSYGGSR